MPIISNSRIKTIQSQQNKIYRRITKEIDVIKLTVNLANQPTDDTARRQVQADAKDHLAIVSDLCQRFDTLTDDFVTACEENNDDPDCVCQEVKRLTDMSLDPSEWKQRLAAYINRTSQSLHYRRRSIVKFPIKLKESAAFAADRTETSTADSDGDQVDTEGNALLSIGEDTMLQKALTAIHNPKAAETANSRLPLDCESNHSCRTETLAEDLKLNCKPFYLGRLFPSTVFAFRKSVTVSTKSARIQVLLNCGIKLGLSVNVIPIETSPVYRAQLKLAPFNFLWKDECGFWRCRGRMTNASDLSFESKQPRVLPVKAHFTRLVVKSVHESSHHAGVSQTLATVRNEFWIPRGRTGVGSVLAKCLICRKYQGGPFTLPQMPDLPGFRISPNAAFTYVGLDYLGPLYVKTGNITAKVWICLFTCLTVRAIHLELVRGLDSEQFMLCLRRFIAKRGKPVMIISDNAPQFKLAHSAIQLVWSKCVKDDDVVSFSASQGIIWKFIVEFAPWSGGFYERLVGVVKRALRKALGKLSLHFDQLATLLTEIEATVNCRPLTFVGKDNMPDQILTPSNFLTVNPKIGAPHMSTEELSDPDYVVGLTRRYNIIESWRRGVAHLDRFWSIWSKDYLLSLRESMALKHKEPRIHSDRFPLVGQVVLIKEPLLARSSWKLGRIEEVISGYPGNVRGVSVRLPNRKIINRPVNLPYPLECEEYVTDNAEGRSCCIDFM